MKNAYNPIVTAEYRQTKKGILKDFQVWQRMSRAEKAEFRQIQYEVTLDRFAKRMFDKYNMG